MVPAPFHRRALPKQKFISAIVPSVLLLGIMPLPRRVLPSQAWILATVLSDSLLGVRRLKVAFVWNHLQDDRTGLGVARD